MHSSSSKELYIMNGGNKRYIYTDGFGDVYQATPAEEAEWAKEVIGIAIGRIETLENATSLKFAIDNLLFHHYPEVESLLKNQLKDASPKRQIAFAAALWNFNKYDKSFEIIHHHFVTDRKACLDEVFSALVDIKNNDAANLFLVDCLEGEEDVLIKKAGTTIGMWAYTGIPQLRYNNLLEKLKPENKDLPVFDEAMEQVKSILKIKI